MSTLGSPGAAHLRKKVQNPPQPSAYKIQMSTFFLFIATVLIWGTTWIAIALQVGEVPVVVSIFYRFALAGFLMLIGLLVLGRLKFPVHWRFVVLQALCLFCFNFIGLYKATTLIPSGLVSVVFSLASMFNAINARIFFGERITFQVIGAGVVGTAGIFLLFWHDLFTALSEDTIRGIAWATFGTIMFSFGNMASRQNSALGISPVTANAWGMGIGAVTLLMIIVVTGQPIVPPQGIIYWTALIYLALIGSVVAFTTYLLLVQRIGSAKAGYATVIFPVVALAFSTLFEEFRWTSTALMGASLVVLGNFIIFARKS